ncbi:MqnA/MqnD/SBP family protein [Butyrivibrio sp. JL13D10]|uniref:ABC transporter substrate-binding protein n=1 Tax=Butyrivibrio sp. JL13D10 TaxID=3236815 RepID=UPI0038B5AF19
MKKFASVLCIITLCATVFTGCNKEEVQSGDTQEIQSGDTQEVQSEDAQEVQSEDTQEIQSADITENTEASEEQLSDEANSENTDSANPTVVRIGSLKGPTTMGLVNLMKDSENEESVGNYQFDMKTQPDEIMAGLVAGDIDIALVPANMASVLYNKTEGGVRLLDINTLGVLYCVTGDDSVKSVKDLAGKTVISTGQGASPEYVLRYLLDKNGVNDCNIEFKSEATEIAAILQEDATKIAILPQPFVTVATTKNENVSAVFDLTDEWDAVSNGSKLITGVTVVRKDFLNEHPDEVKTFIDEHEKSTEKATSDVEGTANLVAEYGIIEKAPIAAKAIPECNIVCITGDVANTALSGYLQVLYDQEPKSIGGAMPGDDFYTID